MHDVAAAHFTANLEHVRGGVCRDYLAGRGLSPEIQSRFGLGWSLPEWQALQASLRRSGFTDDAAAECGLLTRNAKGGVYDRFRARLMFPIRNLSGRIVAFGGRILPSLAREDDAKYINSSDSPLYKKGEHLYGLVHARSSIMARKSAMLTEGYMDVLTLHQFGYTQAAGVLGTALTPEQIRRLSGFCSHIELLFDGDNAGRKAALRACEMLLARGLSCKVVLLPDQEDIDSLLRSGGQDAFEALRRAAPDGLAFCLSVLRAMAPKDAVAWVRSFLDQVELPELFHRFASELSAGLDLAEGELRRNARTQGKAPAHDASSPASPALRRISPERAIMTFAVRYPHSLPPLRDCGADLLLTSPWTRALWEKLERFAPEEIFAEFNEQEKQFWILCRDTKAGAPALDNENRELDAVRQMLDRRHLASHSASVARALRQAPLDYETQREFMRALKEARGRRGDP
jgi:DNA primase